jgi:hypothetical protein
MEKFGEVMDVINSIFLIVIGIGGLLGLFVIANRAMKKTYTSNTSNTNNKTQSGQNLMSYLEERIESAGHENNPMKNSGELSPSGFIMAMNDERELIKSQAFTIARQFNVPEMVIRTSVDNAYNRVYNKYIE